MRATVRIEMATQLAVELGMRAFLEQVNVVPGQHIEKKVRTFTRERSRVARRRSAQMMQLLPEHLGGDQRDSIVGDMKAPAVFLGIDADLQARRNVRTAVHHDT